MPLPTSLVPPLSTSPCSYHPLGTYHLSCPSCEIIGPVLWSYLHLECQVMRSFLIYHPTNPCLSFEIQILLPCVWPGSRWPLTAQAGGVAPPWCSLDAHSISVTALITMLSKLSDSLPHFTNSLWVFWRKCHINWTFYSQGLPYYGEPKKSWGTKSEILKMPL